MNEKCKSTLPSAIQVKNWRKTISIKAELVIISWLEKGEKTVDIYHTVIVTHISVCTICHNADRITESAKARTRVFVWQDYHSPIRVNLTKIIDASLLYFYCIRNKYIVQKCTYTVEKCVCVCVYIYTLCTVHCILHMILCPLVV